jgi:hypothetical protein
MYFDATEVATCCVYYIVIALTARDIRQGLPIPCTNGVNPIGNPSSNHHRRNTWHWPTTETYNQIPRERLLPFHSCGPSSSRNDWLSAVRLPTRGPLAHGPEPAMALGLSVPLPRYLMILITSQQSTVELAGVARWLSRLGSACGYAR